MDTPTDPAPSSLCSPDERFFERGLQTLIRRWKAVGETVRLSDLLSELRSFGAEQALGSTEVSRRVQLTVEAARLPERQFRELAGSLGQLPATVRQAVIASIPPSVRRLAYAPQAAAAIDPSPPPANPTVQADVSTLTPATAARPVNAPALFCSGPMQTTRRTAKRLNEGGSLRFARRRWLNLTSSWTTRCAA